MAKEKKKHIFNTSSILMGGRDEKINFLGKDFLILRNVFSPKTFPSTKWFSKELSKIIKDARIDFLEMGCGSGMISIFLAIKNKNIRITCVDLNNFSIKNTKLNIKEYELRKKIKPKQSDIFSNIKNKFDMIFWAIPFGYLPKNKKINILEKAVFDPGYKSIRKFVKESKNHLNENGRILIGFSRDIGDFRLLEKICKVNGFLIELVSKTKISEGKNKVGMEIYELMAKY